LRTKHHKYICIWNIYETVKTAVNNFKKRKRRLPPFVCTFFLSLAMTLCNFMQSSPCFELIYSIVWHAETQRNWADLAMTMQIRTFRLFSRQVTVSQCSISYLNFASNLYKYSASKSHAKASLEKKISTHTNSSQNS